VSPIAGNTRFRKHQIGKQTALLTAVPATRVLPYRGPIEIQPNREFPEVDTGSLDPTMAPFSGAKEITSNWTGKVAYDDTPYIFAAAGKGGEVASGATAKTWVFDYASLVADDFEYLTDEWGDDTHASDGLRGVGGVIDSYTFGFDETLAAVDLDAQLVYADAQMAQARTPGLSVDSEPNWVYGADFEFFLDTTAGGIGGSKWVDAIHTWSVNWQNNLDRKRFANGSNTRFKLAGYGRGERTIEIAIQVAKTAYSMAEAATLDDVPVPLRFLVGRFISPEIITGSTPYSLTSQAAARLMSRADGEIGGNSTITLTYRVVYDTTLGFAIRNTIVNTLAAL